ncbi:hypothetical protein KI440_03110 [Candidatus Saccharibacteria bacterium TM7i]|nr:hypothetical protein KI440_03110 [Candidatus Saccharibacteria bacterium TM7i]
MTSQEKITTHSFEVKKDTTPPLNEVVTTLLADEEIQKLPEAEQGRVIVDRFIGSLVRHGGVESSNAEVGVMNADEILSHMDKIGTNDENGLHTIREITRTDGLRESVKQLAGDARTAQLFGHMTEQLGVTRGSDGTPYYTLTTRAQMDGYIEAGGKRNDNKNVGPYQDPQEWVGVFMSDIDDIASGYRESRSTSEIARDVQSADSITPEAHKRAQELYAARSTANVLGIDTEMMRRSAEFIRDRDELTKRELGARAVSLAMRRPIQRYRDSHNAWFDRRMQGYR